MSAAATSRGASNPKVPNLSLHHLKSAIREKGVKVSDKLNRSELEDLYEKHCVDEDEEEEEEGESTYLPTKSKSKTPAPSKKEANKRSRAEKEDEEPEARRPAREERVRGPKSDIPYYNYLEDLYMAGQISKETQLSMISEHACKNAATVTAPAPQTTQLLMGTEAIKRSDHKARAITYINTREHPFPTELLLKHIDAVKKASAKASQLSKDHLQAVEEIYGEFLDMVRTLTQSELQGLFAEGSKGVPHEAFLEPYRIFLGHLCAIFVVDKLTVTNLCISGIAKSYYCSPDMLLEDVSLVQKTEVNDPVSLRRIANVKAREAQATATTTPAPAPVPPRHNNNNNRNNNHNGAAQRGQQQGRHNQTRQDNRKPRHCTHCAIHKPLNQKTHNTQDCYDILRNGAEVTKRESS